jgi:hypothetical protein
MNKSISIKKETHAFGFTSAIFNELRYKVDRMEKKPQIRSRASSLEFCGQSTKAKQL